MIENKVRTFVYSSFILHVFRVIIFRHTNQHCCIILRNNSSNLWRNAVFCLPLQSYLNKFVS